MRLADGRRVQGSLVIAQTLERLAPNPPLYPRDAQARRNAECAERWGEAVLQPIPRRLLRWGLRRHLRQRQWFAAVDGRVPAPALAGALMTPIVPLFIRQSQATDERIRQDIAELPAHLDEVDRLLGDGVLRPGDPGAAELQIASSLRALLAMEDVGRLLAGRPAGAFARALIPDYPTVPAALPLDWLPAPAGAAPIPCAAASGNF
jgi:glutathione S-transferase